MPPKEKTVTVQDEIVRSLSESQTGNLSVFRKFKIRYKEDVMAARVIGPAAAINDIDGGFNAAHNMMVAVGRDGRAALLTETEFAAMYHPIPEPESKPKKPKAKKPPDPGEGKNTPGD